MLQHADLMFWLLVPMLSGCGPREGNSQSRYQITHYKCGEVHEGIAVGEDIFPHTIICTTEYLRMGRRSASRADLQFLMACWCQSVLRLSTTIQRATPNRSSATVRARSGTGPGCQPPDRERGAAA